MNFARKPILFTLAVSSAFLPSVAARSPPSASIITTDGIPGFTVGTHKTQIAKRLGSGNPNYDEPYLCDIHEIKDLKDVSVMIQRGRVTSVIIYNPRFVTNSGARVGMGDAALKRIYGQRLKRENHTYQDAPAAYYTFRSSSGNEIVFDVNEDRKVGQIRAGYSAGYVEGCL